jgi:TfoX/Sxy family transcriptional regulator of competence genes
MPYDEELANRIREQLAAADAVTEKAMFGGLAFLLRGNMAVGITSSDELMVRVGQDGADEALARPYTRPFDMSGRPMRGWIIVAREGLAGDPELGAWVQQGVQYARGLPPKG